MPRFVEGYWRNAHRPDLPMPELRPEWEGREAFLSMLDKVEATARHIRTKGMSFCRICDEVNGSNKYVLDDWLWPDGFRHYVADHQVRPSAVFERFIKERSKTTMED